MAVSPLYRCWAPVFIVALGVVSIIELVLGFAHAIELSYEPIADSKWIRRYGGHAPTMLQLVLYTSTVPLASLIWALLDTVAFVFAPVARRELVALAGSSLVFAGWIVQSASWTRCEEREVRVGQATFCPQYTMTRAIYDIPSPLHTSVQRFKLVIGWVMTTVYALYVALIYRGMRDKREKSWRAGALYGDEDAAVPLKFSLYSPSGSPGGSEMFHSPDDSPAASVA